MQASVRRLRAARKSGESGFTLIEILVVIVILGVLAAIVIFAVGGLAGEGVDSACRTDGKSVDTATEAHYAKKNAYPTSIGQLKSENFLKDLPNTSPDPDKGKYWIDFDGTTDPPTVEGFKSGTGADKTAGGGADDVKCYPKT